MTALTTQTPWLQRWVMLVADALFEKITNPKMKLYMEGLLANGLILVTPPTRIWHSTPLSPEFREHILDQLLVRATMITLSVTETLLWNRSNGISVVGGWELRAARIHATAQLKLEAGALNYQLCFDPFLNWDAERSRVTLEDFESNSSDESTTHNYCSSYPIMKPINILAWNVRGAANSQFRRAFRELVDRHKPNVVLLTETRVGGDRADDIINSLGFPVYFKVDPMGFAGGLWLLWNNQEINMHIESHSF